MSELERGIGKQSHHRVEFSILLDREGNTIKPETLMLENSELFAEQNIGKYLAAKANGNLTVIDTCADARVAPSVFLNSQEHVLLGSIAGGTPRGDLKPIINNPFTKQILILGHHDGDTVSAGKSPDGCGGLHEKGEMCNGHCSHEGETAGLTKFVDKYLRYSDVLAHTYDKARYTASLTDKPVMSATVDHLTGKIYPIAVFSDGGRKLTASLPIDQIERNLQDFQRLTNYEGGVIPTLKLEDMPESFAEIIVNNQKQVEYLFNRIPNFSESQKVQDPHTVYASSVLMPPANRYPRTYRLPNTFFKVFIPQNDCGKRYESAKLIPLLEQIKYPLLHTIKHRKSGGSFASVANLMVETSNLAASEAIVNYLLQDSVVQKWIEISNGEVSVMAAEVSKGKTRHIQSMPFK